MRGSSRGWPSVLLWPTDRTAYGRLCRLLSLGRLRTTKGLCQIYWEDIAGHAEGMLAGLILQKPSDDWMGASLEKHSMAERWNQEESEWSDLSNAESENQNEESLPLFTKSDFGQGQFRQLRWPDAEFPAEDDASWKRWLNIFRDVFGAKGSLCVSLHHGVDDESKLQRLIALSKTTHVPLVATGHVLYHQRERSLLHDCLTAIAVGKKISDIASYRPSNAEYGLRPLKEIFALFGRCREALQRTGEIAEQIHFSLEELRFEYPTELAPDGREPMQYLKELTWEGAKRRYPKGVPDRVVQLLKHEVALISELRYEAYFLTVWDLVRFARSKGILCQGRGSAANSIVCYCLGVTSVDPFQMDLLFERFISKERNEAPDIDVDFEHQRREEVLQYIYQKYGRHRLE